MVRRILLCLVVLAGCDNPVGPRGSDNYVLLSGGGEDGEGCYTSPRAPGGPLELRCPWPDSLPPPPPPPPPPTCPEGVPFSLDREVVKEVNVRHAYDECSTTTVYYLPEAGDIAYPPCWGHGGPWLYDGEIWGCLDGTTRQTKDGPGRPYDDTACRGLELGCAYGVYSFETL